MIWALVLGYAMFGETPTVMIVLGSAIIAGAGLFVIWREHQLALKSDRRAGRRRRNGYDAPNALNVMMVRVSATPAMVCTFSAMKWPISVDGIDVEFHQQIEIAGGRIDFRGDLGVGELVGDLVGLAELAFDLHEKGDHARLRTVK